MSHPDSPGTENKSPKKTDKKFLGGPRGGSSTPSRKPTNVHETTRQNSPERVLGPYTDPPNHEGQWYRGGPFVGYNSGVLHFSPFFFRPPFLGLRGSGRESFERITFSVAEFYTQATRRQGGFKASSSIKEGRNTDKKLPFLS